MNKDFKIDPENLMDLLEAIEDPRIVRTQYINPYLHIIQGKLKISPPPKAL